MKPLTYETECAVKQTINKQQNNNNQQTKVEDNTKGSRNRKSY